jgi:hypothetical protein
MVHETHFGPTQMDHGEVAWRDLDQRKTESDPEEDAAGIPGPLGTFSRSKQAGDDGHGPHGHNALITTIKMSKAG